MCCALTAWGAVWARTPPIQDYPNHLADGFILFHHPHVPQFQEVFQLSWRPAPYLVHQFILFLFMPLGPDTAGRILLLLTALSIPCALLVCLRWTRPGSTELAFLAFPLVWNKLYFKGNLAFLLGVGAALLAYGWLHRAKSDGGTGSRIVGIVLCTLVYFAHGVAFLLLSWAALVSCAGSPVRPRRTVWRDVCLSLMPGFLLLAFFLMGNSGNGLGMESVFAKATLSLGQWTGKVLRVEDLLWSFHRGEWQLSRLFLVMACCLLAAGGRKGNLQHRWVCLLLVFLYLIAPIDLFPLVRPYERVFWFLLFFSPLAMEFPGKRPLGKTLVMTCCLSLFVAQCLQIGAVYRPLARRLEESRAVLDSLPRGRSLVSLWREPPRYGSIKYGSHLEAYYVVDRQGIVRSLFSRSYQLVRYRDGAPIRSGRPVLAPRALAPFDFCLAWNGREPVECELLELGYLPFISGGEVAVYESQEREGSP